MATYKNLNQNLRQELRLLGSIPDKINGQTNVTYGMYMTKRMNQMQALARRNPNKWQSLSDKWGLMVDNIRHAAGELISTWINDKWNKYTERNLQKMLAEHERDMELLYGIADISNAPIDLYEQEISNQGYYKWGCDERAYDY